MDKLTDCPDHCGARIPVSLAKQIEDPEDFDAFCPTDVNARALALWLSEQYSRDFNTVHKLTWRNRLPLAA